jgi:gliding motility-associated-like protein
MKSVATHSLMALAVAVAATGCKKDVLQNVGGPIGLSYLELSVDSACIQAPNVFTPNGDGVNDIFFILSRNIVSIEVRILNSSGQELINSNELDFNWNGLDSTGTGPYAVKVQALTTSGITIGGQSTLTRMDYTGATCLSYLGTPVSGDQFDPRICGPSHPTNEVFCP